jgi:hypothetical protein
MPLARPDRVFGLSCVRLVPRSYEPLRRMPSASVLKKTGKISEFFLNTTGAATGVETHTSIQTLIAF